MPSGACVASAARVSVWGWFGELWTLDGNCRHLLVIWGVSERVRRPGRAWGGASGRWGVRVAAVLFVGSRGCGGFAGAQMGLIGVIPVRVT